MTLNLRNLIILIESLSKTNWSRVKEKLAVANYENEGESKDARQSLAKFPKTPLEDFLVKT